MQNLIKKELEETVNVFNAIKENTQLINTFEKIINACIRAIENNGKILFIGNGGSAADSQHLATELVVRFLKNRKPLPAIALTTDTSILTATGNDFGFDYIFDRQIEALGNKNDVLIAISTSGKSQNILKAIATAKNKKLICVGFTGSQQNNQLCEMCDYCLCVNSNITYKIQEAHIALGHILCLAIENHFLLKAT